MYTYAVFMLCFLPSCYLFSHALLPNSQNSDAISSNSNPGSPNSSDQGPLPRPNTTVGVSPLLSSDNKPAYNDQKTSKAPEINPTSSNYQQHNPTVLHINPPYIGQVPNHLPTQYGSQSSEPAKKNGIWDWLSWPKTWLFGNSDNLPKPVKQYSVLQNPNRPYPYNQPSFQSNSNPSSVLPTPAGNVPNVPQTPPNHNQGLYQVPAPNSKFQFVPLTPKYPTNFPAQPLRTGDSESQSKPENTSTTKPSSILATPTSPAEVAVNTAPKTTYDTIQQTYPVYLLPSKPIFTSPSTTYNYPAPPAAQYPPVFRYPPYGMPNVAAQPYYQSVVPTYGDFGYLHRYPFFNNPQPLDTGNIPTTVKTNCCTTPKPSPVVAVTVDDPIVVPQQDILINVTNTQESTTLTSTTTSTSTTTTTEGTTSTTPASTTTTETTNVAVTDATVNSTTSSVPDLKPLDRQLFSVKNGTRGYVDQSSA